MECFVNIPKFVPFYPKNLSLCTVNKKSRTFYGKKMAAVLPPFYRKNYGLEKNTVFYLQ